MTRFPTATLTTVVASDCLGLPIPAFRSAAVAWNAHDLVAILGCLVDDDGLACAVQAIGVYAYDPRWGGIESETERKRNPTFMVLPPSENP